MIPADLVLLGSSGENDGNYVPLGSVAALTRSGLGYAKKRKIYEHPKLEISLQVVKQATRISLLGFPNVDCQD